jgi:hypothetical protein
MSNIDFNGIQFKVENNKFIMEVDFDTWKFATENSPIMPMKVTDTNAMKEYIKKSIDNGAIEEIYNSTGDEEVGQTMWHEILDRIMTDAYENGVEWLSDEEDLEDDDEE